MVTKWQHREIIIVLAADADPHGARWTLIAPDTGERLTFSVPLSPTGLEPPTHYACNTALTDVMLALIRQAEAEAAGMALARYRVGLDWNWTSALADAGLQMIKKELD